MKLVIFADDFTGAMDTGIQFAQRGIATGCYSDKLALRRALSENQQEVYIINTNTRHLPPLKAYNKVYELASMVKEAKVDGILKKTDSALRGNIASELAAVLDATEGKRIFFLPAYPKMNRSTVDGIQYIDGVMVDQSVFGKDPFEPVMTSSVKEISSYDHSKVCNVTYRQLEGLDIKEILENEIIIFDGKRMKDLESVIVRLWKGKWLDKSPFLLAGCAGIGEAIAKNLPFQMKEQTFPTLYTNILVVCGSLNEITKKQVEYGEAHGFYRQTFHTFSYIENKDSPSDFKEYQWLDELKMQCEAGTPCIIDTGFPDIEMLRDYSTRRNRTVTELGIETSQILGDLLCYLTKWRMKVILMIIGGDTLQGFVESLGFSEIQLLCELEAGVALCLVKAEGIEQLIITKSGGFGEEDLLVKLLESIQNKERLWK